MRNRDLTEILITEPRLPNRGGLKYSMRRSGESLSYYMQLGGEFMRSAAAIFRLLWLGALAALLRPLMRTDTEASDPAPSASPERGLHALCLQRRSQDAPRPSALRAFANPGDLVLPKWK